MNNTKNTTTVILPMVHLSPWERIQLHPSILVFCLLLLVVGVPSNSLILYIYTRRINIKICGFFIKTLAVIDLINCFGVIPAVLIFKILPAVNSNLMCKYLTLCQAVIAVTTGGLYAVIAFQRFMKICRSQKPQLTEKFAKILTFLCIVFSFISGLPFVFIMTNNTSSVEWKYVNETTFVTFPFCDFTEISKHLKLSLIFPIFFSVLLVFLTTSPSVLYLFIWRHVKTSHRKVTTTSNLANQKGNRPSSVTKMFIVLTVIYFITLIPKIVLGLYISQSKRRISLEMAHLQILDIVTQLPYLKCVVNPFVYGFSSKRFRNEVVTSLNIVRRLRNTYFAESSNIQTETAL